jgi:hypothetical protein
MTPAFAPALLLSFSFGLVTSVTLRYAVTHRAETSVALVVGLLVIYALLALAPAIVLPVLLPVPR